MSFEEADEVPDARSLCSIRTVRKPRPAASRAIATPLMPPPIMARSKSATDSPLKQDSKFGRRPRASSATRLASNTGSAMMVAEVRAMDLANRHVVVTGGAGALGSAVVVLLANAGATCHVACFNEAEAERFRPRAPKGTILT